MKGDPLAVLPKLPNFIGFIDLRSGAFIIAALGIVHTVFFGCTFFMALSYQLVTIWILVVVFSGFSCMLLYGVHVKDDFLISVWIWYALVFVSVMFLMMFLFICVFCSRREYHRIKFVTLGILWYILTIYFIFVVNSYRMDKTTPENKNSVIGDNVKPSDNDKSKDDNSKPGDDSAQNNNKIDSGDGSDKTDKGVPGRRGAPTNSPGVTRPPQRFGYSQKASPVGVSVGQRGAPRGHTRMDLVTHAYTVQVAHFTPKAAAAATVRAAADSYADTAPVGKNEDTMYF